MNLILHQNIRIYSLIMIINRKYIKNQSYLNILYNSYKILNKKNNSIFKVTNLQNIKSTIKK